MLPSASASEPGALTRPEVLEAITQANQKNSPLLRLPAEIRNQIYANACDTVTVEARQGEKFVRSGSKMRLVCRQVNKEITNIVEQYSIVQFQEYVDFSALSKLPRSEAVITMEIYRDHFEDIWKLWDHTCNVCGPFKISFCPSLRRVKVHNWDHEFATPIEDRNILRDVFCNKDLDIVFI